MNKCYDKDKYDGYIEYVMDKPKQKKETASIKPDAPSPVMTENNKKYYGQSDWDKMRSNMGIDADTFKNAPKSAMEISYDGDCLTANIYKISQQGDTINQKTFKKKAYSGRPIGQNNKGEYIFDFSPQAQKKADTGPLPEGNYYINPQNVQRYDPNIFHEIDNIGAGIYNRTIADPLGVPRLGDRPGGKYAWGAGLIDITPDSTNNTQRSGFTIHGGKDPGSAGCIDLLDNDDDFFNFVEQNRGGLTNVPLKVDYSKK